METNRRSSKRHQKIPTHFNDSVHDLNKKKDNNKNKGTHVKSKKEVKFIDQANLECLGGAGNQEGMFDDLVGGNKNSREDMVDNEILNDQKENCFDQGDKPVEEGDVIAEKLQFGSVCDEMLASKEGYNDLKLPTLSTHKPNASPKSYVNAATNVGSLIDNKLMTIPTDFGELGFKMRISELRYNLRRMRSRYGLKDVIENDCGMIFFKFNHEEGMNYVVDNGPWMVNNKPLVVQKWDVNMNIERTEPDTLPLWIKLCNPPLEALTIKGISALASRIGKPLIMDARTASMCKLDVGRIGYARVLVEVYAKKV
ncbi:zinc knuckle CX2CX4HX4C containing protein [Tanacetum coccineum]